MPLIISSSRTYSVLEETGIVDLCRKTYRSWDNVVISGPFSRGAIELYDSLRNKSGRSELEENVLGVEKLANGINDLGLIGHEKINFLIDNPVLLSFLAVGQDLDKFKEYGFSSRREFEEAVTSLCIGDREIFDSQKKHFSWRNRTYKNSLSNSNHGDLFVGQTDVSFPDNWRKMESYEGSLGFGGGQNGWGPFLIIALKYAHFFDLLNIPQIADWKSYTHNLSNFWGTIDTNMDLENGRKFYHSDIIDSCINGQILKEGVTEIKSFPIRVPPSNGGEKSTFPYIKDNKLFFVQSSKGGDFKLDVDYPIFRDGSRKVGEFEINDLPKIFEGIYRLYARDRNEVPIIMNTFLSEVK